MSSRRIDDGWSHAAEQLQQSAVDRGEARADAGETCDLPKLQTLTQHQRAHDDRTDRDQQRYQQQVGGARGRKDPKVQYITERSRKQRDARPRPPHTGSGGMASVQG